MCRKHEGILKKLLELRSEFIKVTGRKIKIQISVVFLYISSEQLENGIQKTPFNIEVKLKS